MESSSSASASGLKSAGVTCVGQRLPGRVGAVEGDGDALMSLTTVVALRALALLSDDRTVSSAPPGLLQPRSSRPMRSRTSPASSALTSRASFAAFEASLVHHETASR